MKLKTIITLVIILFVSIIFNTNIVNATTEEDIQKVLDIIPNTMQLNISQIECEKAGDIIILNLKRKLRENNIIYNTLGEEISSTGRGLEILIDTPQIYKKNIDKTTIKVQYNNICKEKSVKLIYNNQDKYNTNDEKYVKNLKIESPHYYICPSNMLWQRTIEMRKKYEALSQIESKKMEYTKEIADLYISSDINKEQKIQQLQQQIDELEVKYSYYGNADLRLIENYYNNLIDDNSITIKASASEIGEDASRNRWTLGNGTYIGIYKDNVLYDIRELGQELLLETVETPDNIATTVEEYMNFINKQYEENGQELRITKIENGIKKLNGINIPNVYTLYGNDGSEHYSILQLGKTNYTYTIIDDTTSIKLEAGENVVPQNTVLVITELNKDTGILTIVTESLKDITDIFIPYDFTLKSGDTKIQPNGKVKISIPIPDDFDKTKLTVYRIEEDGTKVEYKVIIEGNYATFETDHFSTYVLAEKKINNSQQQTTPSVSIETTNKTEKDNTPKTGTVDVVTYIAIVTVISAVGMITFRKKETK